VNGLLKDECIEIDFDSNGQIGFIEGLIQQSNVDTSLEHRALLCLRRIVCFIGT
jgi:hypothetical protein